MSNNESAPTLDDPRSWRFGPFFEIQLKFAAGRVARMNQLLGNWLRDGLELAWVSDDLKTSNTEKTAREWRDSEVHLATWNLGYPSDLGIKLIQGRNGPSDLLLAMPPNFVRVATGLYSWSIDEAWVSPAVVDFHLRIIKRLRKLHSTVRLQAVLLQDETWKGSLLDSDEGIYVRDEVAHAAWLTCTTCGIWSVLPL